MVTNVNTPQQSARVDVDEVRKLADSMSAEDGVFSTDIKTLKRCRDALRALADEIEQLRSKRAGQ